MRFVTNGLLSKWGFNDGDQLWDFCYDLEDRDGIKVHAHPLLIEVVKRRIVPALDQSVSLSTIQTIHNPIRATEVDGRDVTAAHYDPDYPDLLTPDVIEVADDDILAIARELGRSPESDRSNEGPWPVKGTGD